MPEFVLESWSERKRIEEQTPPAFVNVNSDRAKLAQALIYINAPNIFPGGISPSRWLQLVETVMLNRVAFFCCVLSLILSASSLAESPKPPTTPRNPTLWDHNGSVMYLIASGSSREFYYKEPRPGMLEAGARPGSLLFRGQTTNGQYFGTAFIFDRLCGQLPYQVSGPILNGYDRVVLMGQAPRLGPNCIVNSYVTDTLEFTLLKPEEEKTEKTPTSGVSILVPLQKERGTYVVRVLINKEITLPFVLDSGAADVSIPADVVLTLNRTGTLEDADFIGTQTYILADGSTVPSATFRIRSLTLGSTVIENVTGSVARPEAHLLLGQSFLSRFKSWSIDNAKQVLVLRRD
jgi:clan AA aspartic protease (TIGR02281 family)